MFDLQNPRPQSRVVSDVSTKEMQFSQSSRGTSRTIVSTRKKSVKPDVESGLPLYPKPINPLPNNRSNSFSRKNLLLPTPQNLTENLDFFRFHRRNPAYELGRSRKLGPLQDQNFGQLENHP